MEGKGADRVFWRRKTAANRRLEDGVVKRVRVLITGRVQGVFFRADCAKRARELGLGGWVRNRADGAVEATFEGVEADVDAIIGWCRRGPELAVVDFVEETPEPLTGDSAFRILG